MLLSRAFCLILGTSLFVMIWTMQDGNHRPTRMARSGRTSFVGPTDATPVKVAPASKPISHQVSRQVEQPEVKAAEPAPTPVAKQPAESMLWMFADEPAAITKTQVAGK